MTLVICLGLFAFFGMLVALWTGYNNIEEGRRTQAAAAEAGHDQAKCLLCNRPLPRNYTRDEVVTELERRIDADTAMVVSFLRQPPAPEVLEQIYHA